MFEKDLVVRLTAIANYFVTSSISGSSIQHSVMCIRYRDVQEINKLFKSGVPIFISRKLPPGPHGQKGKSS